MTQLFGTDGIRGKVNSWPMTAELALQVGKALAKILKASGRGSVRVLIGKDTRRSGYMFESALEAGLVSMGADVYMTGPIPTPVLAWMTKNVLVGEGQHMNAGIMITASHNPAEDNGLKIFTGDGFKLSDAQEAEIEALVLSGIISSEHIEAHLLGKTTRIVELVHKYIDYAKSTVAGISLKRMRIVLDTANGAAYDLASHLFEELGVEIVYHRGDDPNGDNINAQVGVGDVASLAEYVKTHEADLAICLDGDADRVIFLNEKGEIINGDYIIGLLAKYLKEQGRLENNHVVVTQMSNLGLLEAMDKIGVRLTQAPVGDRYVIEAMRKEGCNLGGEQSGHIIFLDHVTTGDGLITALQVMALMSASNRQLSELTSFMVEYPQCLKNFRLREVLSMEDMFPHWKQEEKEIVADLLGNNGRIFVRRSGTEKNLLRVLIEAKFQSQVDEAMERIELMLKNSGFLL